MKIKNIDGLSAKDLQEEAGKGGRFIYYAITVSLIIVTFKRTSGVYLVRGGENAVKRGLIFTLMTALLGWWGIPFGPKYTWLALRSNLQGGIDVTEEVMSTVAGHILFQEAERQKRIS